jgi:hypothetical protein
MKSRKPGWAGQEIWLVRQNMYAGFVCGNRFENVYIFQKLAKG